MYVSVIVGYNWWMIKEKSGWRSRGNALRRRQGLQYQLMGGQQSAEHARLRVSSVNKNQSVITKGPGRMSRNNVFKLSGNMALGGGDNYPSNDFDNIKSSLKLLKSKQSQKRSDPPLEPTNMYGGSYSSSANQRQPQGSKNHPSQDYNNYNYQQSNPSRNQANSYKDVYQQMEQHFPNDYPSKPRRTQNYEQYEEIKAPPKKNMRQPPTKKDYNQDYQNQYRAPLKNYDNFEEKTIKEVNRQNRVQIREYDPSELVECRQGCGRSFNPESISKHEAVCKKVFQKKRKEFNAQDQRLVANQQKKLMKKGEMVEKKIEQKKATEKIPKWKAESLQLRAGIKQARSNDYVPSKEEQRLLDQAKANDMVKCQFCGRSFNEKAATRHIPFCEAQQKKNMMKRR